MVAKGCCSDVSCFRKPKLSWLCLGCPLANRVVPTFRRSNASSGLAGCDSADVGLDVRGACRYRADLPTPEATLQHSLLPKTLRYLSGGSVCWPWSLFCQRCSDFLRPMESLTSTTRTSRKTSSYRRNRSGILSVELVLLSLLGASLARSSISVELLDRSGRRLRERRRVRLGRWSCLRRWIL